MASPAKEEAVVVGQRLMDRFTVEDRLGGGGFGVVYRAWDERLQRPVAVKVIESGSVNGRVLREAQAAARLNHRGIVTLYELGGDERHAYLVAELVEGRTLRELARDGALTDRIVAEIGAEICEALAHAHRHGVVHRDVKPENVVVRDADGLAKLMDFGIARIANQAALTAPGEVLGTLAYMAPEQAEGLESGPSTDCYALALSLYECWTGRNPLARRSPAATARAIGTGVPLLASQRPDLPPALTVTVDRCLESDPKLRPAVAELERALIAAAPALDGDRPVPLPTGLGRGARMSRMGGLRIATLAVALAALAWVGFVAQLGGIAIALAVLGLPVLFLPHPAQWALPALAPLLGAAGLAPVYAALAGLGGRPRSRVAVAALGAAWLVAAEAAFSSTLLFGIPGPAPEGWERSVADAASGVLAAPLLPRALALGALWALAAYALGAVLRGRMLALEGLVVLLWAGALLAAHGPLAGSREAWDALPLTATLVTVLVVALWLRSGLPRPRILRSRAPSSRGAGERAEASVVAAGH